MREIARGAPRALARSRLEQPGVLRAAETPVDWLVLTPPMTFAADGERTGVYRSGGDAVLGERMSYADFAIALLDEIEAPAHHRTRIAVSS